MSITRLGPNKYKIIIECGYDMFGKRIRHSEIFYGTPQEAKIQEADLTKKYYHKVKKKNKNIVFEKYSIIFIENYCLENVSNITLRNYKQMLKRINEIIGKVNLTDLTAFILDRMYKEIRKGKKGKILSDRTMTHYYNLVGLMLKQAVIWKFILYNVNVDAKKPPKTKTKRNFYELNDVQKLFNCLKTEENIKYRALLTLTFDSGARRGEIVALRWSDIDFEKHTVLLDNSLKVIYGEVDEENAKTEASIRTIYISEYTINVLKEYKKWQDLYIKKNADKWKGTDRVFTSRIGTHMHPDTCGKILTKIINKYDLAKITPHEFRHTVDTLLLESGINPKAVSDRSGHADTRVTMEIYAHIFSKTKQESANVINKVLTSI
ncbi:MAG: site-specific integrase [Firmicutes bacterium]|nr:site-specific integrase [Bacillota bacterium]